MSWKKVALGDFIDYTTGSAFKSKDFTNNPDDIPLVKGENIGFGNILWEKSKFYPKEEAQHFQKFFLRPFDIVLAMDRPWIKAGLKFGWIKEDDPQGLLVQRVALLRGKNGLSQNFLRYVISSPRFSNYLKNIQGGVGVPHISGKQIKAYSFKLPPYLVRQKIVSILSSYDSLIENNLKRIQLLEEIAQNIYKKWFVKMEFPGYQETNIIDGLPLGWREMSFEDTADFINGYAFKPKDWFEEGIPIIKISELKKGITGSTPRNSGESIKEKYHIKNGDILFSWSAHLEVYFWSKGKGLLNQHLFKVVPKEHNHKYFLFYALKNSMEIFRSRTTGSTMKHIKRSELKSVFVKIPSDSLIKMFSNNVKTILKQIVNLSTQNEQLKEAKDILIPRLMNDIIPIS